MEMIVTLKNEICKNYLYLYRIIKRSDAEVVLYVQLGHSDLPSDSYSDAFKWLLSRNEKLLLSSNEKLLLTHNEKS
jgi:hypothetical protein